MPEYHSRIASVELTVCVAQSKVFDRKVKKVLGSCSIESGVTGASFCHGKLCDTEGLVQYLDEYRAS